MLHHHPTIAQTYQTTMRHRSLVLGGLVGVLVLSVLVDCAVGPAALSPTTLLRAVLTPAEVDAQTRLIIWQIRLPYALMAACVGAALGLAGAEMQTILANPLASPFTLGLSAAGAFGASLAIVLDWHTNLVPDMWLTAGSAFVCSALSVWILDMLVRLRQGGTGTVILCGVALVFSFQALVALMQFVANEDALQNLVFWTLGSLTRATWSTLGLLGGALACIFPFSFRAAWPLTTLRMGEDRAASLGVDVPRLRRASLLRISLLCALAVAFVGVIGFIGLVAPHIARRLVGEDHRFYLPASMLSGACILSLAALVARVLVPGVVVPTGIVTALVGIPFFLVIVLRRGDGAP
ncbi:iron ABC transporter permease [Acetobacter sp. LMG 32666]|uniref:FecCD family ABC transporter permease n=1 Tax=Acetobacter sp. LMG 32666 TaxID=2959295 RepID=UPI0030C8B958